jgi:hypothetical protein
MGQEKPKLNHGYPRGEIGAICKNQHFDLSDLACSQGALSCSFYTNSW